MTLLTHPHQARADALSALFGREPSETFDFWRFTRPDDPLRIDVLAYPLDLNGDECVALLTSGLSDSTSAPHELLQYVPRARGADAQRLHGVAYRAVAEGRPLDYAATVTLPRPAGTAWPHAVLLPPPVPEHSENGPLKLLWHVPLSDSEFAYQRQHGLPALLKAMSAAKAPWIFDEATRPVLL